MQLTILTYFIQRMDWKSSSHHSQCSTVGYATRMQTMFPHMLAAQFRMRSQKVELSAQNMAKLKSWSSWTFFKVSKEFACLFTSKERLNLSLIDVVAGCMLPQKHMDSMQEL